ALVRLEVGVGQDALDSAAAQVAVMGVAQDVGGEVIQRPAGGGDAHVGGLGGGQGDKLVTVLRGEKWPAGHCAGGRLGRRGVGAGSVAATWPRCRRRSRTRWRPAGWWAGRRGRSGG